MDMVNPATIAMGTFRFGFLISPVTKLILAQPSYAQNALNIAPNKALKSAAFEKCIDVSALMIFIEEESE